MASKLINVRLTNCYGKYFKPFHAWIDRLCQCNNMTVTARSDVDDTGAFWVRMNENTLSAYKNSSNTILFGTMRNTGTDYTNVGLSASMSYYNNKYFDYDFKMIVDENNNLVFFSYINYSSGAVNVGILFTNGGIMNPFTKSVYSMGANPSVIGQLNLSSDSYAWPTDNGVYNNYFEDYNTIYLTDCLMTDENNNLMVRDHVKQLFCYQLNDDRRNSTIHFYETISAGNTMYMHIGYNQWIEIGEIKNEIIEVQ